MNIDLFNSLDELEQAQAIWQGIHIKTVVSGLDKFLLYNVDGLYVEAIYNSQSNFIEGFKPILNADDLIVYYIKNDISALTSLL